MTISGHKTRSVFEGYNIVSERDLESAALQIAQARAQVLQVALDGMGHNSGHTDHIAGADRDGEETQDVVEITGEKSLSHGAGRGGRTPMTARVGGF